MWMEGADLPFADDESPFGLNETRCALVLKEKLSLYQSVLEIADLIEHTGGFIDEDLFAMMDDLHERPPKKAPQKNRDIFQFAQGALPGAVPAGDPKDPSGKRKRKKTKE